MRGIGNVSAIKYMVRSRDSSWHIHIVYVGRDEKGIKNVFWSYVDKCAICDIFRLKSRYEGKIGILCPEYSIRKIGVFILISELHHMLKRHDIVQPLKVRKKRALQIVVYKIFWRILKFLIINIFHPISIRIAGYLSIGEPIQIKRLPTCHFFHELTKRCLLAFFLDFWFPVGEIRHTMIWTK